MRYINKSQELVICKFLQRYDYDGVLDILIEAGIESGDLYDLLNSWNYQKDMFSGITKGIRWNDRFFRTTFFSK